MANNFNKLYKMIMEAGENSFFDRATKIAKKKDDNKDDEETTDLTKDDTGEDSTNDIPPTNDEGGDELPTDTPDTQTSDEPTGSEEEQTKEVPEDTGEQPEGEEGAEEEQTGTSYSSQLREYYEKNYKKFKVPQSTQEDLDQKYLDKSLAEIENSKNKKTAYEHAVKLNDSLMNMYKEIGNLMDKLWDKFDVTAKGQMDDNKLAELKSLSNGVSDLQFNLEGEEKPEEGQEGSPAPESDEQLNNEEQ